MREFQQIAWDAEVEDDCRQLIRLAIHEDFQSDQDWTTVSLVPAEAMGSADVVARSAGVIAGLPAAQSALSEFDPQAVWTANCSDGAIVSVGQGIATMSGKARILLSAERLI